jgi:hypothetical protein
MLKGTKTAILRRIQPISIHGQVFLDIAFTDPDALGGDAEEIRHARVGDDAVPHDLAAGDTVTLHYILGNVTRITK